jgi:hypothetical protein
LIEKLEDVTRASLKEFRYSFSTVVLCRLALYFFQVAMSECKTEVKFFVHFFGLVGYFTSLSALKLNTIKVSHMA